MSPEPTADTETNIEQLQHSLVKVERLLAIGFSEQIRGERKNAEIDDEVSAEILRRTATWTAVGALKREVQKATGQSGKTVQRRFNKLIEVGALERRGNATSTEYRNSGLFG
jgi:hypothetical protein